MTRPYQPQPVPQVIDLSAANDILWDLTVADYRAWRKAFYARSHIEGDGRPTPDQQEQIELNLLKAYLLGNRLADVVVNTYLSFIELRPREKVDPFFKKPEAK